MSDSPATELETLLDQTGQPKMPLRRHQVEAYQEERDRLHAIVTAPPYVTGADRGHATKRFRELDGMLKTQAPRPIEDVTLRNRVHQLATALKEEIRSAMLPREVMRRNPAGAVDTFLRQENHPATKRKILTWKRAMFALDPTTDDRDHANLEKIRPELTTQGTSGFMADAQIPGHFAMSPQAKANWPEGMPPQGTVNSALAQVQARETKPKRVMSEAQKAALALGRQKRLARLHEAESA